MIEIAGGACPAAKMCETLEVSQSAYYQWLQRRRKGHVTAHARQDQRLSRMLVKLHQQAPSCGLDTRHAQLRKDQPAGRRRVNRLMHALNIHSCRKRAYRVAPNSRHNHPIAPNLLNRCFTAPAPNRVWVGGITYIPTDEAFAHTAIIKDLFHHKVVNFLSFLGPS